MGWKYGLLLVAIFPLLTVPLHGQSILTQTNLGTGFIVSSDGYIITNRHVIEGASRIIVTMGSSEYEATVVDSLPDNDIALLKVDAYGLPAVMLGDSDRVQIGDTVYAIGCPGGVCGTVTQGRVANLGVSSETDVGITLHNLIMCDLTTTHGSSGGPLVNDKGEVIGITTSGVVVQGETTGFGLSIPINQAIPLLRRVPEFSTSQMGRATTVLALDEIRRSVQPATVFVQAEVQRPLSALLPDDILGIPLVNNCFMRIPIEDWNLGNYVARSGCKGDLWTSRRSLEIGIAIVKPDVGAGGFAAMVWNKVKNEEYSEHPSQYRRNWTRTLGDVTLFYSVQSFDTLAFSDSDASRTLFVTGLLGICVFSIVDVVVIVQFAEVAAPDYCCPFRNYFVGLDAHHGIRANEVVFTFHCIEVQVQEPPAFTRFGRETDCISETGIYIPNFVDNFHNVVENIIYYIVRY